MTRSRKSIFLALIILLVLLFSIGALFFFHSRSESGELARIYQDGKLIREVSLTDKKEPYQFRIDSDDGGYNLIQVANGAVGIVDANCPDKICQQRGMVSDTGYPITCLPHKLVIKIERRSTSSDDIDAVVQ